MINVFIGYDKKESGAAYVLSHSIQTKSSIPVSITLLNRESLRGVFLRPRGPKESTDFSISRFLVPYLCNYKGHAIFMDCDMVCLDDIAKLWAWRDEKGLRVVKHDHRPVEEVKFLNQPQSQYGKKNWSSLMLFNNEKCTALTPQYVNTAGGLDLHQFKWLPEDEVGDLPNYWNKLVGYDGTQNPSMVHYTSGGPYFDAYRGCDHNIEWYAERASMLNIEND